jgi:hypothetical protein
MPYEIHSFGLSVQANRGTGSEWIERRTGLAFPLLRSLRNILIPDKRSTRNRR